MDDAYDVPRRLVHVERFVDRDDGGGHLAAVECGACVRGGKEGHERVVLSSVAVAAGDEEDKGAGAEGPVVEAAVLVEDCCADHLRGHGK